MIHPTAIIGKNVNLGSNVEIGPYAVVDGNVKIGDNTKIEASCRITEIPQLERIILFFLLFNRINPTRLKIS